MEKVVIGAPFGNYLHFPHTTPTLGTFTLPPRGGLLWRLWRVLSTVRYYPRLGAWVNRLGLPNPGIDAYLAKMRLPVGKIVSVMGHSNDDWWHLIDRVRPLEPLAIECNVSCPNCPGEDRTDYARTFEVIKRIAGFVPVIVKLPPIGYESLVQHALAAGIDSFHCCNTLPTPGGGMSGKPLQPLSLRCLADVRQAAERGGHTLRWLIGGGGVTGMDDARRFFDAGATSVSVASVLFFPWRWASVCRIAAALAGRE